MTFRTVLLYYYTIKFTKVKTKKVKIEQVDKYGYLWSMLTWSIDKG